MQPFLKSAEDWAKEGTCWRSWAIGFPHNMRRTDRRLTPSVLARILSTRSHRRPSPAPHAADMKAPEKVATVREDHRRRRLAEAWQRWPANSKRGAELSARQLPTTKHPAGLKIEHGRHPLVAEKLAGVRYSVTFVRRQKVTLSEARMARGTKFCSRWRVLRWRHCGAIVRVGKNVPYRPAKAGQR